MNTPNSFSNDFDVTLLFCDIRGFTSLLANSEPREGFKFMEKFFQTFNDVVESFGGTINNLMGDGFLAEFGIRDRGGDHTIRSVNCAIEMRLALISINKMRYADSSITFAIGIGLHTGRVAGGEIRLGDNKKFILVGNDINFASRIESLTKDFSVDILASEELHSRVSENFEFFEMEQRKVRGREIKVKSFWLAPHANIYRGLV